MSEIRLATKNDTKTTNGLLKPFLNPTPEIRLIEPNLDVATSKIIDASYPFKSKCYQWLIEEFAKLFNPEFILQLLLKKRIAHTQIQNSLFLKSE